MIDFIEGTVESKAPGELVISAGGVGFLLLCSNATLAEAPAKGEKWRCYSVLNVREDAMELFGFASRQERAMFKKLCQVTGVGAKTALGVNIIASHPDFERIYGARADKRRKLSNGGMTCTLYRYRPHYLSPKPERPKTDEPRIDE